MLDVKDSPTGAGGNRRERPLSGRPEGGRGGHARASAGGRRGAGEPGVPGPRRAVTSPPKRGIRQFLDIGTGLPAPASTHEVAQTVAPGQPDRVRRQRPAGPGLRPGPADRQPGGCVRLRRRRPARPGRRSWSKAARTLDFTKPVAVLLLAILHFLIPDADSPAAIVARLANGLAPGIYLAISHMTADFAPDEVTAAASRLQRARPGPCDRPHPRRGHRPVRSLPLVAPGVVPDLRVAAQRPRPACSARRPLRGARPHRRARSVSRRIGRPGLCRRLVTACPGEIVSGLSAFEADASNGRAGRFPWVQELPRGRIARPTGRVRTVGAMWSRSAWHRERERIGT